MAKKLSKSRKKTIKHTKKKSWLQSLLTFPALFIIAVVGMAIFTVYYVSRPSNEVMGVSTANYVSYTQAQVDAFPEANPNSSNYPSLVRTRLWLDSNGDGKKNPEESCIGKKYSYYVNGVQKTYSKENCEYMYVKVPKCNTSNKVGSSKIKFDKALTSLPYKLTGIYYEDFSHKNGAYAPEGSKTVTVCGNSDFIEGAGYSEVLFGVKK